MVEDTQKRYADDATVQELVRLRVENDKQREGIERLRVENERLREALKFYAEEENWHIPYLQGSRIVVDGGYKARSALQQKESK